MTKKQQLELEQKEVLDIPQKAGFGTKDCFIATETLSNKIVYSKYGKGSEDLVWVIEDIRKIDSGVIVEREEGKVIINLSRDFEIKTFNTPRKTLELTEREIKRIDRVKEAIANLGISDEEYTDELVEQKILELPKVVSYDTEDENEKYYIKNEQEIWVNTDYLGDNADTLLVLAEAYLKSKGVEKENPEYLVKFEQIVSYYV